MITLAECEKTGNAGNLDSTMVCAGEAGKDACQVCVNVNLIIIVTCKPLTFQLIISLIS